MKIRTQKDIDYLALRIREELNLDIQKYKNEEVAENFVDLLIFPKYIFQSTIKPIIIAIVIFVFGFFVVDLVHLEFLIYGIVGFFLFFIIGILSGLLYVTWKMKSDLSGIVDYSFDIMKTAVTDLNHVSNKVNSENKKEVLGLLFKGIIHIVTIPMLGKVISEKIPMVGGVVNGFMKKTFTHISDKIEFNDLQLKEELEKEDNESKVLEVYNSAITSATSGMDKVLNLTFGLAQFPLKISFAFMAIILILFMFLIW